MRADRLRTPLLAHLVALVLALGLHTTPMIPGVAKWIGRLFQRQAPIDRSETEVSVELDLDEDQEPAKPTDPEPASLPAPAPAEPEVVTKPSPEEFVVPKPPPPTAAPPKPTAPPAPTAPPPPPKVDTTPKYVDPGREVNIAANPSGNPNNVVIILVGKTLREHPVGDRMGKMLPGIGQWRDFFEGTGIDAVRDVDLMVLQGPQLTMSERVDTVLLFNKPMEEIDKAVHTIIERLKGQWLEDTAVPAALAKADKHERIFMLDKTKKVLYVTHPPAPPNGETWDDAKLLEEEKAKIKKFADLPAPTATPPFAIKMMVTDPGKFARVPVFGQLIPKTMTRLVFQVDAMTEGRARLHIELWDKDPATAEADVPDINVKWGEVQLGALLKGLDIPNATFKADGSLVRAELEVDKDFLDRIFEIGQEMIDKEAKKH
ncbi:MAG: hypothetical protein U0414_39565 [Polyangiaceae bacterium]